MGSVVKEKEKEKEKEKITHLHLFRSTSIDQIMSGKVDEAIASG